MPAESENWSAFVVEELSAAPIMYNIERSGIDITHSRMAKFSKVNSSSYKTVIAASKCYCTELPRVIAHRWDVYREERTRASQTKLLSFFSLNVDTNKDLFITR